MPDWSETATSYWTTGSPLWYQFLLSLAAPLGFRSEVWKLRTVVAVTSLLLA